MSERKSYFIHSASGSAFGGALTTPTPLTIPTQAMASLSPQLMLRPPTWVAGTIADLEGEIGLPAGSLQATVAAYNDGATRGEDTLLHQLHAASATPAFPVVRIAANETPRFKRALDMADSPSHGITFCQGNFAAMPGVVIPDAIRNFGARKKIFFAHFRDIRGSVPLFEETFHDEGKTDMVEAMQAYHDIGFDGPMRPDQRAPRRHVAPPPFGKRHA